MVLLTPSDAGFRPLYNYMTNYYGVFMRIFYLLFSVLLSTTMSAQVHEVTKILNTNLFELSNGELVTLYGLIIPTENYSNKHNADIAGEILEWEKKILLGKSFKIEFIESEDSVKKVILYRTYAFGDQDIAKMFLDRGYASLIPGTKGVKELLYTQNRAQQDRVGIWAMGLPESQKLKIENIEEEEHSITYSGVRYERPYKSFLFASAAFLGLAWDSFISAADAQKLASEYKKFNIGGVDQIERSVTRKTVMGLACIAAAIATTMYSFKSVEVKSNLSSVSLKYNF
jgi:hypothetical protein